MYVAPDSKSDLDADMAVQPGAGFYCASGYPQGLWSDCMNDDAGELITLDGSPPIRVNLENFALGEQVVWSRKNGTNVQEA